ncbi:MAG TPA: DUF368 domain-containing protein [Thermoanaerobaculia bacterium]|nr:DUF368 domain-containing protein [Thermoanaerobaculia bacterium]
MNRQTELFSPRPRNPREAAGLVARGFCMGAADVVPGVSGGTMAFILGIYEELIDAIRMVGRPQFLRPLSRLRIAEALAVLNWKFLLSVAAGIGLAILTLAQLLEWLLVNRPVFVWSFFFGLVLASVITVAKRIARWSVPLVLSLLAGLVFAYILVGLVPLQTPDAWWFLFFSGAVAICAMILPGISGAFVLLLLGKYQYILGAVNQRDIAPVFWVGLGASIGIVTFAQFLGWLFRNYHDLTVAMLTGLMLGSLRKVWPWKVDLAWVLDRHGARLPTVQRNILPDLVDNGSVRMEVVAAILLATAGFAVVVLLEWWASRKGKEDLRPGT